jgi:hypothetical protein
MSLIQRITARSFQDVINQGFRFSLTGSVGTVTDTVIQAAAAERTIVVTGIIVSTSSAIDVNVTIGFKGTGASVPFFSGYIKTGSSISYPYPMGDERYSNVGDALVITTDANGPVVYTVNGRIIGEKVSLGYIQIEGAGHSGAPGFPPQMSGFSGLYRGGFGN